MAGSLHRRARLSLGILPVMLIAGCGSSTPSVSTSNAVFSPHPAIVASGLCVSRADLISSFPASVSVVSAAASFVDGGGARAEFSLSTSDLAAAGPLTVPPRGVLALPLEFDLGAEGLSLPAEGTVVFVATGVGAVGQFVGGLRCEAP